MNALSQLDQTFIDIESGKHETHPFYLFEPWDVAKRSQEQIEQALKDGVDLHSEEIVRHLGSDPHLFQSGFLTSNAPTRAILAGNQVGKSKSALVDMLIMASGEIPFAMRVDAGVDTGIKRLISPENVRRFGRFDAVNGTFIDNNGKARNSESWNEWDCGTIKGVGKYPQAKIAPPGSMFRIGTYQRGMTDHWWPILTRDGEDNSRWMPPHFLDIRKGVRGANLKDRVVHLCRECKAVVITYESGKARFEQIKTWATILDEEPPGDEGYQIFQAVQQHVVYMTMCFTPYLGVTWSKKVVFPERKTLAVQVFHATQYDSPYQNTVEIDAHRQNMQPHDIATRVYGIPTDVTGGPYYDRRKVSLWLQRFKFDNYKLMRFQPATEYHEIDDMIVAGHRLKGLLSTQILPEETEYENETDVWRMYEEVKPGLGYVLTADPALGAENPEDAADLSAGYFWRLRTDEEIEKGKKDDINLKPVLCASIGSTLEPMEFARICGHAMHYYNNALCAAESPKRGAANAAFAAALQAWPFWYTMATLKESTNRYQTVRGFDMTGDKRNMVYEYVRDWLNEIAEDEYPQIPDEPLLRIIEAAIKGKKGRCDHTKHGKLDRLTCFAIFLYIFNNSKEQITCNYWGEELDIYRKRSFFEKMREREEEQRHTQSLGSFVRELR